METDEETRSHCKRCGRPVRGSKGSPGARMLRRAKVGFCVECGIVNFLQQLGNMYGGGLLESGNVAEALRLPHVQAQFAAALKAGHSDATPEEIDWERVIDVWDVAPPESGVLF